MRLLTAEVAISTSSAAARPPPIFLHSVCEMTPLVDHSAQRGRLAGSGRPGDLHEALVQPAQVQNRRREPELLGGEDVARDDAEDRAHALAVNEDVGAEARQPGDLPGEVGVASLGEFDLVLPGVIGSSSRFTIAPSSDGAAVSSACIWPSLRTSGVDPTDKCRSEAFASHIR
jgi:hypothetical protein